VCTYTLIDSERCAITRGLDKLEGPAEKHAGGAQRGRGDVREARANASKMPSVSANATQKTTISYEQQPKYPIWKNRLRLSIVEPQMCHLGIAVILPLHWSSQPVISCMAISPNPSALQIASHQCGTKYRNEHGDHFEADSKPKERRIRLEHGPPARAHSWPWLHLNILEMIAQAPPVWMSSIRTPRSLPVIIPRSGF